MEMDISRIVVVEDSATSISLSGSFLPEGIGKSTRCRTHELVCRDVGTGCSGITSNSHFGFGLVDHVLGTSASFVVLRHDTGRALRRSARFRLRKLGRNKRFFSVGTVIAFARLHEVLYPIVTSMTETEVPYLQFLAPSWQVVVVKKELMCVG